MKALSILLKFFASKPRYLQEGGEAWSLFLEGRHLDAQGLGRRDPTGAFACHLRAAQLGLPVATVLVFLAYRVGDGVLADEVAATAWSQRATELGWPNVFLVTGDGLGGHGQEAVVDP